MKLILFEPNDLLALVRRQKLNTEGHTVVAHAKSHKQLEHLMAEFGASCIAVGPTETSKTCGRPGCAANVFNLLVAEGHPAVTAPQVWEAALPLAEPETPRAQLVAAAREAFLRHTIGAPVGLSLLPAPWLAELPSLLAELSAEIPERKLPLPIFSVSGHFGIFEVFYHLDKDFALPKPGDKTWWSRLRRELNLKLYPTLWQPLKPAHWRKLHAERPDLRHLLERKPWRAKTGHE